MLSDMTLRSCNFVRKGSSDLAGHSGERNGYSCRLVAS